MFIQECVDLWKAPAKQLLRESNKLVGEFCTEIINRHFKKYDHSGLLSTVKYVSVPFIVFFGTDFSTLEDLLSTIISNVQLLKLRRTLIGLSVSNITPSR